MKSIKKSKKTELFIVALLLISCGLFFIAGCGYTSSISSKTAFPWAKLYSKDLEAIEKGNQALKTGDIENARNIFQNLRQQAKDPVILQRSLCGLAIADLALANNAAEFEAAFELWNQWIKQIPPGRESCDPRLFDPLLQSQLAEKKEFLSKLQILQSRMQEQNQKDIKAKDIKIETLDGKIKTKNQEIRKLEQKLDNLRTRIQTLEHQINAMKTIDQKIQKKKKEITTP